MKKKSTSIVISESDTDKKVTIFASESDGDNMHGGNDPDDIMGLGTGHSFLSQIGIKPGSPVDGPILPIIEGKSDLDLNNISLTTEQISEVAGYFSKRDDIKTLSIRNSGLNDIKFIKMAGSIKDSRSDIMMLNLNLNKLTAASAEKISELIVEKPSLVILLLYGNPVGDSGTRCLVDGLLDVHAAYTSHKDEDNPPKYCHLSELDLGDTNMSDAGVNHVATLLEANTGLKTLNLNGNTAITLAGWKRLGKALKKNTTLQTLSLDFNKIGDDGLSALISGLKDNQNLKTLELENTSLTEEGGRQLIELLKCNTTILDISVPGNAIPEKLRGEIRNYLGLNKAASQPNKMS